MIMYLNQRATIVLHLRYPDITWEYNIERELMRVMVPKHVWEDLVSVRRVGESESALVLRVLK